MDNGKTTYPHFFYILTQNTPISQHHTSSKKIINNKNSLPSWVHAIKRNILGVFILPFAFQGKSGKLLIEH